MSDDIELVNAGEYLNKLCADMSASKSYYYDIQYTLSTTLLEYRLKYSLTSKDMASYLEVSPSMLSNYESGDYDFSLSQICDICEKLNLKLNLSIAKIKHKGEYCYDNKNYEIVGYKDFGCVYKNSCI